MKNLLTISLSIAIFCMAQSCELLGKEAPFTCNKNTVIEVNGETECGIVRVDRYRISGDLDPSEFEIFNFTLSYSGVTQLIDLSLFDQQILEGRTYYSPEASYGGNGVSGKVEISIIKIDRVNRSISASFFFSGKYFNPNNSTSYDHSASGTFTNVNY